MDNGAHQVWADAPWIMDPILEFLLGGWPTNAERVQVLDPMGE